MRPIDETVWGQGVSPLTVLTCSNIYLTNYPNMEHVIPLSRRRRSTRTCAPIDVFRYRCKLLYRCGPLSPLRAVLPEWGRNFFQGTLAPTIGCRDLVSGTVAHDHADGSRLGYLSVGPCWFTRQLSFPHHAISRNPLSLWLGHPFIPKNVMGGRLCVTR
jgi:hypothetical protein